MPGAGCGDGSVVGVCAHRAAQGAVCACPKPYSPMGRPVGAEHKSRRENVTQSDTHSM